MNIKLLDIFLAVNKKQFNILSLDDEINLQDVEFAEAKMINAARKISDAVLFARYKGYLNLAKTLLIQQSNIVIASFLINLLQDDFFGFKNEVNCDLITTIFNTFLSEHTNALSLTNLFRYLVDTPLVFAAIIRYLCINKFSPEQILSTHLLHDYLDYYLCSLHLETNEVNQLFSLLDKFPETQELARLAKNVRCNERGFNCFALDGSVGNISLYSVEKESNLGMIDCKPINLEKLYKLFGAAFIKELILQWSQLNIQQSYIDFLTRILNDSEFIKNYLAELLNILIENGIARQAFANLLDFETLIKLIEMKNHAIMALIPYNSELIDLIESQQLQEYLQISNSHDIYKYNFITGLVQFIEACQRRQKPYINLLLTNLIDTALAIPEVFEDEVVPRVMRKFNFAREYCEIILRDMKLELDNTINFELQKNIIAYQQLAAESLLRRETENSSVYDDNIALTKPEFPKMSIEQYDFVNISDVWRRNFLRIEAINNIFDFQSSYPLSLFELYMYVVLKFSQLYPINNLAELCNLLNIKPEFGSDVTIYERFLIELMQTLENDTIRNECIEVLNNYSQRNWLTFDYNGLDFYSGAILKNNLSLINWLQTAHIQPQKSYLDLLNFAIELERWEILAHFCNSINFDKKISNKLLIEIVRKNAGEAVKLVWLQHNNLPSSNQAEESLKYAIKKNYSEIVENILKYVNTPNDQKLTSLFKSAISSQNFDCAKCIVSCASNSTPNLLSMIEDKLIDAVRKHKVDSIKILINTCRNNAIAKALYIASRESEYKIAYCILENKKDIPNHIISKALAKAHGKVRDILDLYSKQEFAYKTNETPLQTKDIKISANTLSKYGIFSNLIKNNPNKSHKLSDSYTFFASSLSRTTDNIVNYRLLPPALKRNQSV